jgi:gas vesicle protein
MKSFLMGLGIGVGLGVLFAPARGEETRRDLGDRLSRFADDAQLKAQEVAQNVRNGVESKSDCIEEKT